MQNETGSVEVNTLSTNRGNGGGRKKILIVIIVFLVLVAITVGVYYWYSYYLSKQETEEKPHEENAKLSLDAAKIAFLLRKYNTKY